MSLLALVAGTLAKIATDVMLLMQTEVGEAFEPFVPGPRLVLDHAAEAQPDLLRADRSPPPRSCASTPG